MNRPTLTRAPMARIFIPLLGITSLLPFVACSDDDDPAAQGPVTHSVTVTITQIGIVADCEPAAANAGDFTYELIVIDSAQEPADYRTFTGSFSGTSGTPINIPDVIFTMAREPKTGDSFILEFHVTEWDGATPDARMNDSIGNETHAWTTGTDWNNGPHTVTVTGDPECEVHFIYSVTVD